MYHRTLKVFFFQSLLSILLGETCKYHLAVFFSYYAVCAVGTLKQLNMSKRRKEGKKIQASAVLTYVTSSLYLRIYFSCVLRQTGATFPSEIPYRERERARERESICSRSVVDCQHIFAAFLFCVMRSRLIGIVGLYAVHSKTNWKS